MFVFYAEKNRLYVMEKELITTDRRELQELLDKAGAL